MSFGGGGSGGGSISASNDVFLSNPADNQTLKYDVGSAKWQNATLPAVALSGDYNDLTNKPTGSNGVVSVEVSTGSESRPSATTVLWIGGLTQPTNMAAGDLWFSPTALGDTTPPSVPTGLASSNITATSFSLTWNASSDNVGVTGYEIQLDGISYSIVAGTSANITGRSSNTPYVCTVRARDAAGNWSAYSSGVTVTTDASGSTEHTVFGTSPYPGSPLRYTEASPITVATQFYTGNSGTTGWKIKGMRLYIPTGTTMAANCDAYLFTAGGLAPDLAAPTSTANMSITAGQWNEVDFSSPVTIPSGEPFWVGYRFADTSYMSTASVGNSAIQASDGSQVFMALDGGSLARNLYRVGNGVTSASSVQGQGYGIDVIISEV